MDLGGKMLSVGPLILVLCFSSTHTIIMHCYSMLFHVLMSNDCYPWQVGYLCPIYLPTLSVGLSYHGINMSRTIEVIILTHPSIIGMMPEGSGLIESVIVLIIAIIFYEHEVMQTYIVIIPYSHMSYYQDSTRTFIICHNIQSIWISIFYAVKERSFQ